MSILKTQPENSHATNTGWVSNKTGELLVGISHLVDKMEAELAEVIAKIDAIQDNADDSIGNV